LYRAHLLDFFSQLLDFFLLLFDRVEHGPDDRIVVDEQIALVILFYGFRVFFIS
jgi:hypothetical protein